MIQPCLYKHLPLYTSALGYSTKVYFNACCKPSPLFDFTKVCTTLPFSYGPGHIVETMQAVLQIMVNLCHDPIIALQKLPKGNGPPIVAHTSTGEVSQGFPPPTKMSEYWLHLYNYATLLNCCENFLSATIPSAPCLLCHPFGRLHPISSYLMHCTFLSSRVLCAHAANKGARNL